MDAKSIINAVESVTKPWAKQRKAEERGSRRPRMYYCSDRVNFTEVAEDILPEAYMHGSGDGKYTISQRNFFYAAREAFREATGREIDFSYFSQTILRKYLNTHDVDWKVTADPRGTFIIPNTTFKKRIPVGTLQIDEYLRNDRNEIGNDDLDATIPIEWPSMAEGQRYAAVLYIEKEGFEPMMNEARIAERFDLALLSCKGQSVVAARKLVDHVCSEIGVPLFVVHDFDTAGFQIANSLTKVSKDAEYADRVAYHFENEINVTDFGLRLADVKKYELASEKCKPTYGTEGMTSKEIEFMRSGRRVELNAFTAPQFIEWLEGKLQKHLPNRLIPTDDILDQAYRRAVAVSSINSQLEKIRSTALEEAASANIPKSLRQKIKTEMKNSGEPWDVALYSIADCTP